MLRYSGWSGDLISRIHKMAIGFGIILLLCLNFVPESTRADPGRDLCKIVTGPGLKCSKISSYLFPYDMFFSFNDDLAQFTADMKYLEIGHSNISVLQGRSFQRTPQLSHLVMSKIHLVELEPGAFEGLTRLKSVDLSYNLLQLVPMDAFKYAKLNQLKLDGNPLLAIPPTGPFLNAPFLTFLGLRKCNIQDLSGQAFRQTPALIHLDLSQNYLQTLPEDVFAGLRQLTFIDLSGNQFRSLEVKIFESMPLFPSIPESVILSGNPWVCDCKIAKLGDWLARNIRTGAWSETPRLSRLKKLVECERPDRISWNTVQFKELISSC